MLIRRGIFAIATFVLLVMAGYHPPLDMVWEYLQSLPESERGVAIGILVTLVSFACAFMIREGLCFLFKTSQILDRLEDIEERLNKNNRD